MTASMVRAPNPYRVGREEAERAARELDQRLRRVLEESERAKSELAATYDGVLRAREVRLDTTFHHVVVARQNTSG
jgi:uncharacterized NAD(P)/FAD-binding protein YdhS